MCNSEKKDNLFRKRYKLRHGDKCYSIIKYFCPEVEFISIKIMETGERGSIESGEIKTGDLVAVEYEGEISGSCEVTGAYSIFTGTLEENDILTKE